ncbi:hypothetical protein D3C87_2112260 [compost metagenome]
MPDTISPARSVCMPVPPPASASAMKAKVAEPSFMKVRPCGKTTRMAALGSVPSGTTKATR